MSPQFNNDKAKELKEQCIVCSKPLTKKYMATHMKIHKDKGQANKAAATKILVNDLMTDMIQKAVEERKVDEEDLVASRKDQEDGKVLEAMEKDQEDEQDMVKGVEEMEIELDLRDIHAKMSQQIKQDLSRTKMIPDENWTKTLNCSDMEIQFEQMN